MSEYQIILSLLALWLVFRRLDARSIGTLIGRANLGWLGVATGLFVISKLLSACRLQQLFGVIGVRLTDRVSRELYWLGMFYNLFLPGGIGGDGYKVWLLHRQTGTPVARLVTATLLDRVFGLLVLLSMLVLLLPTLPASTFAPLASFVGLRTTVFDSPDSSHWPWIVGGLTLITLGLIQGGSVLALRRFFTDFRFVLWPAMAWSAGLQVAQGLCLWAICRAVDASGAWTAYQFIFLASTIVSTLPLTIGGAGARELTFLAGAAWLDLRPDAAVSVSLLFYGITVVISLTGAYFVLNDSRFRHIPSA